MANLVTLRPRLAAASGELMVRPSVDNISIMPGHSVRAWTWRRQKDVDAHAGRPHTLVTVVGNQMGNLLAPGFQTLDIRDPKGQLPIDRILKMVGEGTYMVPDGQKKPVLTVMAEDDKYWYIKLGTGLIPTEVIVTGDDGRRRTQLWTEPDLINLLQNEVTLETHGFHDLGGANSVIAREAGINFETPESKRLWSSVSRSRVFGTDISQYRSDLIRLSKEGGEGTVKDIDGTFLKLTGYRDEIGIRNASGDPSLEKFWNLAEAARRKKNAAERERYRLQKASAGQGEFDLVEDVGSSDKQETVVLEQEPVPPATVTATTAAA